MKCEDCGEKLTIAGGDYFKCDGCNQVYVENENNEPEKRDVVMG
jgi:tRNA(Ile2) C34 agmatinyltransferase TiaS